MACHEPTNGGGDCLYLDDIEALKVGRRSADEAHAKLAATVKADVSAIRTDMRQLNRKMDRVIDGIQIGNIRPAPSTSPTRAPAISIDWDADEPTGLHEAPVWSARAKEAYDKAAELQAELAAANATLKERERNSERVRNERKVTSDVTIKKWQIIAGAIVGSGAVLAAIGQMIATILRG